MTIVISKSVRFRETCTGADLVNKFLHYRSLPIRNVIYNINLLSKIEDPLYKGKLLFGDIRLEHAHTLTKKASINGPIR